MIINIINPFQTERDVSVCTGAIDLLYAMCDHSNAQTIVEELMQYLERADYSIRETLVTLSHTSVECVKTESIYSSKNEMFISILFGSM